MEELRLFRSPSAYAVSVRLTPSGSWIVVVDRKFEGEAWRLDDRSVYEGLSLAEAADVLLSELFTVRP